MPIVDKISVAANEILLNIFFAFPLRKFQRVQKHSIHFLFYWTHAYYIFSIIWLGLLPLERIVKTHAKFALLSQCPSIEKSTLLYMQLTYVHCTLRTFQLDWTYPAFSRLSDDCSFIDICSMSTSLLSEGKGIHLLVSSL